VEDVESDEEQLAGVPAGEGPPLHGLEVRPAGLVEDDELTVEEDVGAVLGGQPLEFWAAVGQVRAVAAADPEGAGLDVEEGAEAVPLRLEGVAALIGRDRSRDSEHRGHQGQHGRLP
jgi:hypothetical protein